MFIVIKNNEQRICHLKFSCTGFAKYSFGAAAELSTVDFHKKDYLISLQLFYVQIELIFIALIYKIHRCYITPSLQLYHSFHWL